MQVGQGFTVQVFALFLAFLAIVVLILSAAERERSLTFKVAGGLLAAQTALITLSVFMLLNALITSDFANVYVYSYTERDLPLSYKLSALWAGQEGSLLFWCWLASFFTLFEFWRMRGQDQRYQSLALLVGVITTAFFLILCTFVHNPFDLYPIRYADGKGMNPMLQNPGMWAHPPLLYIGFVGFMIPFAHAFASLCVKDTSARWIKNSRVWMLISWVFLTAGIVLGAWWAYVELGWGGYWAWDPVENASLFPWITATALIHAFIMYERRDRLKAWAYSLTFVTFFLTVFGTYLTRSGVMQATSVHSFQESPIGWFFVFFMLISLAAFLISFSMNRKNLTDATDFNFLAKEGVFFLAILFFTALTLAVLVYTMLPVFYEKFFSYTREIDIISYNLVTLVFFAPILLLAGIGAIISYGKIKTDQFLRQYIPVLIASFVATAIIVALGLTGRGGVVPFIPSFIDADIRYGGLFFRGFVPFIFSFLALTVFFTFLFQGIRMVMKSGAAVMLRNRRFFGAALTHIGLVMVVFGVVFSAFYKSESNERAQPGSSFPFDRYTLEVGDVMFEEAQNYKADFVPVDIYRKGGLAFTLYPEIREYYKKQDTVYGEVAYWSMPRGDLYLILQGYDLSQNLISFDVIFRPLIAWIWAGSILMCIGAVYAATQSGVTLKPAKK